MNNISEIPNISEVGYKKNKEWASEAGGKFGTGKLHVLCQV